MLKWADTPGTRQGAKKLVKYAVLVRYPNALKGGDGCVKPTQYEVVKILMKVLNLIGAKEMDKYYRKEVIKDLFWMFGI